MWWAIYIPVRLFMLTSSRITFYWWKCKFWLQPGEFKIQIFNIVLVSTQAVLRLAYSFIEANRFWMCYWHDVVPRTNWIQEGKKYEICVSGRWQNFSLKISGYSNRWIHLHWNARRPSLVLSDWLLLCSRNCSCDAFWRIYASG